MHTLYLIYTTRKKDRKVQRERVRILIQFSPTIEEADKVVESQGFYAVREKLAYLKGMFDFTLVGRNDNESISDEQRDTMDYYSFLDAIINSRWES